MALTRIPLTQTGAASGIDTKSVSNPTISSNKELGHLWLNTTTGEIYVLTDATTGANVWKNIGDGTGQQPELPPTGGTITTDGDYKVHTFTTSGTFDIPFLSKVILSGST